MRREEGEESVPSLETVLSVNNWSEGRDEVVTYVIGMGSVWVIQEWNLVDVPEGVSHVRV